MKKKLSPRMSIAAAARELIFKIKPGLLLFRKFL